MSFLNIYINIIHIHIIYIELALRNSALETRKSCVASSSHAWRGAAAGGGVPSVQVEQRRRRRPSFCDVFFGCVGGRGIGVGAGGRKEREEDGCFCLLMECT